MSFTGRKFLLNEELQGENIVCINADIEGEDPLPLPLFKMQINNEEVICMGFGFDPAEEIGEGKVEPSPAVFFVYSIAAQTPYMLYMDGWSNEIQTNKIIEFIDEPLHFWSSKGEVLSLSDLETWLALNSTEIIPEPEPTPTPTPKQETRYIMTKRGNQDNVVTYEFVCDTTADLAKIESKYVTMGSVAIVIQGDSGFEVYMANSQKEWINLGSMGGSSTNSGPSSNVVGEGEAGSMIIHDGDAASDEVDKGQADSMVLSA